MKSTKIEEIIAFQLSLNLHITSTSADLKPGQLLARNLNIELVQTNFKPMHPLLQRQLVFVSNN